MRIRLCGGGGGGWRWGGGRNKNRESENCVREIYSDGDRNAMLKSGEELDNGTDYEAKRRQWMKGNAYRARKVLVGWVAACTRHKCRKREE